MGVRLRDFRISISDRKPPLLSAFWVFFGVFDVFGVCSGLWSFRPFLLFSVFLVVSDLGQCYSWAVLCFYSVFGVFQCFSVFFGVFRCFSVFSVFFGVFRCPDS